MTRTCLLLAVLTSAAIAGPVQDKKARDSVDAVAAKASGDIKSCAKKIAVQFDWKAFDGIDWKKFGDKTTYLLSARGDLGYVGTGIEALCADKDYRAALGKIDTIVYRLTPDKDAPLKATIAGGELVFTNFVNNTGSRTPDHFQSAAQKAL